MIRVLVAIPIILSLFGCRIHIGANHLFFVTRMNRGFDADTLPPVIEISAHSRFEGVVAPTFEDGQIPPVVASFREQEHGATGILPNLGTVFAAGPAAVAAADNDRTDATIDEAVDRYNKVSEIRLREEPVFGQAEQQLFRPGEAPPMWFGTAFSIGFELEFYGPSVPPIPQSVHLGLRRKEFLLTPLMLRVDPGSDRPYIVRTPSVLALVHATADTGSNDTSNDKGETTRSKGATTTVQFFATGKAATKIATRKEVRHLLLRDLIAGYHRSHVRIKELEKQLAELERDIQQAAPTEHAPGEP